LSGSRDMACRRSKLDALLGCNPENEAGAARG
jgi:hypothetical protein